MEGLLSRPFITKLSDTAVFLQLFCDNPFTNLSFFPDVKWDNAWISEQFIGEKNKQNSS